MPPRKKPATKKPSVRKGTPKPEAVNGSSGFNNQYNGNPWGSTVQTFARRVIYAAQPDDLRRDLSPWDRNTMVKKCRWAERESGLFRQILNDVVLYSAGADGIQPQSHASTPEVARQYEEYFAAQAKRIDASGRFSFAQTQSILLRSMVRDGDAFAIKVNMDGKARVQIVEAHRVGDPTDTDTPEDCWDGIGFGKFNEVLYYNVYRSDGSSRKVEAQAVMHIVDHESASGSRGVPVLQSSLNALQDEMEVLALELRAVKDNGDVNRVIYKGSGFVDENMASEIGSTSNSMDAIGSQMGGKLIVLEGTDKFESHESKRPNSTFVGFLNALEKEICTVLPYEFVKDVTAAGGAGVRLVTAKAARVFGKYQSILIDAYCQPTYEFIIADGIAKGEIPDDPKWWAVSWTTPKSVTVDAGRDAANDRADIEMGLMSPSELFGQRGLDFRQESEKRAVDMAYLQNLSKQYGIPFELLFRPTNTPLGTMQQVDQAEPAPGTNLNP